MLLFKKKFPELLIFTFFIFATNTIYGEKKNTKQKFPLSSSVERKAATGNWYGYRNQLEYKGITPSANFTTDINSNPIGGLKKRTTYAGFLDVSLALDFEKITPLKGTALTVTNYLLSGQSLSKYIGNFFVVQEIYAAGNYFFGIFDLSQSMFKDTLILEIGRLFAGDTFAQSELWQYYVSGSINGNLNLGANIVFPSFNIAAWAARLTYLLSKNWQIAFGIYNDNNKISDTDKYGLYLNLNMNKAYLAIGRILYKHHQNREDYGYPGSISFGGYYQSSKYQYLSDPMKYKRGNYGLYLVFDQMIYKGTWPKFKGPSHFSSKASYAEKVKHPYHRQIAFPKDRPVGLTFWLGYYLAPEKQINTLIYQIATGLIYQGLFPNKNHDILAFCFSLGKFSNNLQKQKKEFVLELNYRFQFASWFYFTPDVQYIIKPNGRSNIPNALVLGFESSIAF